MVVLVTGTIMALLVLSFSGKDYAWSSLTVLCLLILSIAKVGTFVFIKWKIPAEPVVPVYFSIIYNSSAISAGLHLLPYTLPISIFLTISGFVIAKTRCYHELLWVGRSITTISTRLFMLLDESTSTGKSIGLTIIGSTGMGLCLQPMLLALQTTIQPHDMAMGTMLFVAICMLGGSIGLVVFQTMQQNKLRSIISKLKLQYLQYTELIAKAINNQAVIHTSSMPPMLSKALIDTFVVALQAVFYTSIPFAIM
ncbi:hypothetical protein H4S07_004045, partial [Coemansia furcata]